MPGTTAVAHYVYIGENFDDVDAGAGGTFQNITFDTDFIVGIGW